MKFKLNLFNNYFPAVIIQHFKRYAGIIFRQQAGYFFGPLNKTVIARVKILLITHVQRFGFIFKAIKIKVVNGAGSSDIFIYDGEGRTGYRFLRTQAFAQRFDERSFARAHIAVKKEDAGMGRK